MVKSWTEKFETARPHVVKAVPINIAGMKKGEIMLVPSPRIVANFLARIPRGSSMDVKTLRARLARKYKAETTCPITMGFHLRTVAEAALEAKAKGARIADITPFWRVLDEDTPTAQKLSCGVEFIRDRRKKEGLS